VTPVTRRASPPKWPRAVRSCLSLCLLLASSQPAAPATAPRDGQHDFDFGAGTWHTHIVRHVNPFDDKSPVIEIDGTVSSAKIWGGRAWLEQIEADSPKGHWQALNLFLYNPAAHQWSQSFSNSNAGTLGSPFVGEFKDGRAELFAQDTFNDKAILVRAVWSNITANAHRYEEFFSDDGGRTWRLSFTASKTRIPTRDP
jgi:hypothetical protein